MSVYESIMSELKILQGWMLPDKMKDSVKERLKRAHAKAMKCDD